MACQVELIEAVCTKLATDTGVGSLVALTGHNPSNPDRGIRIGRKLPPLRSRVPYVGVSIRASRLISDSSISHIQLGRLELSINDCGDGADLSILRIGDRIEGLILGLVGTGKPPGGPDDLWYYDPSNNEVRVLSFRWFSRSKIFEEEDSDIRSQNILVDVIWHCLPCSS